MLATQENNSQLVNVIAEALYEPRAVPAPIPQFQDKETQRLRWAPEKAGTRAPKALGEGDRKSVV